MSQLEGQRVLVVGASSGIGRCIAVDLAGAGARLVVAARRVDRIEATAAVCGDGAIGVVLDVTDADSCKRVVGEVAAALGGLDAVVYCPGVGHLGALVDTSAETWRDLFATNVTGAALVTAAAIPHLVASCGRAVFLSSESASCTAPWPGLGAYIVTKAALDKLVEAWTVEHPTVGFTRVIVGATAGGPGDSAAEFAASWDAEMFERYMADWSARGYLEPDLVDVADITAAVAHVLTSQATIASIDVRAASSGD